MDDLLTPVSAPDCPRGKWIGFNLQTGKPHINRIYCRQNNCARCAAEKAENYLLHSFQFDQVVIFQEPTQFKKYTNRILRTNSGALCASLKDNSRVYVTLPVVEPSLTPVRPHEAQEVLVGFAKECQVTRFTFKGNWSKPVKPKKWVSDMMRARVKYYRMALAELGYINGVDPAVAEIAITELHRAAERLSRISTLKQDVDKSVADLLSPR